MPSEKSKPKDGSTGVQVSMRHSKITAAEAALLAGELNKPSWQSKNEGIHERVSFEDSIWGFDLAGGSFYKTPLRVTMVKTDSRADKAGIRPGDKLLRINDIDTSTLTIQEAHEIIIESGIHLKIAVTSPDDIEDSYSCWQDQIDTGYDSEEERRKQQEKEAKRVVHAKVSSYWSLQWPWVSKRRVIYRESNCFMVPSKYEDHHREKFPVPTFGPKIPEDIVLHSKDSENQDEGTLKTQTSIEKGETVPVSNIPQTNTEPNGVQSEIPNEVDEVSNEIESDSETKPQEEPMETEHPELNGLENLEEEPEDLDDVQMADIEPPSKEGPSEDVPNGDNDSDPNELETDVSQSDVSVIDDDIIDDVLAKPDDITNAEEDNIFNEILSDGEKPNDEVKR